MVEVCWVILTTSIPSFASEGSTHSWRWRCARLGRKAMAEANVRNGRWAAASTSASSCFRPAGLKGIAVFDGANVPSMATEDDPHEDGVAELLRLDFLRCRTDQSAGPSHLFLLAVPLRSWKTNGAHATLKALLT